MLLQISAGGIFLGCILTGTSFLLKVRIINPSSTLFSLWNRLICALKSSCHIKLLYFGFRDRACCLNGSLP